MRPLALSPDRSRLFAVNTPDNRLEIFTVGASGLTHSASVPVGLEPVAVAARTNGEVWVVNHLSDSVSVVDVSASPPRVVRTLLVGDEPRDIVFAGPGGTRAFITTARRGQNVPASVPARLTTPSTPRALVWVFDAADLGDPLAGTPLTIVELFGDTPRALAASPDGSTVYAAVFHSGNQTTDVSEGAVCNDVNLTDDIVAGPCTVFGFVMPGGLPNPERNVDGVGRPESGLIVKFNPLSGHWEDRLARNWDNAVRFDLPDKDVFAIDANANPPAAITAPGGVFSGVGTELFNMAVESGSPGPGLRHQRRSHQRRAIRGSGHRSAAAACTAIWPRRASPCWTASTSCRAISTSTSTTASFPARPASKNSASPRRSAWRSPATAQRSMWRPSAPVRSASSTPASCSTDTFVPAAASHIAVSGGGPSGLGARRAAPAALRADAVRQRGLGHRHRRP